jgi:hypothetical protein
VLRVEEAAGALTLVSRLARPRALVVLVAALVAPATWAGARAPVLAAGLAAAAAAVLALGGRAVRARLDRGARVTVSAPFPFQGAVTRRLSEFVEVRIETVGEARARRRAAAARRYRAQSGQDLPGWLAQPPAAGVNDHLRRVVLVPRVGEPVAVTAWLPDEEDAERARGAVAGVMG